MVLRDVAQAGPSDSPVSLFQAFSFGPGGWGAAFLWAALLTVLVSCAALFIGAGIGVLVTWAQLSRSLLARAWAQTYLAVFRGVPELLIIYFVYFGSSTLMTFAANGLGIEGFVGVPPFLAGALAVGVISGAYQAEVFRAGFYSITRGELEAAVSVGMHRWLRFRRIIAPQILRFALPALGNLWQTALKDASLISVTGLAELIRTSQVAAGSTHQPFLFYTAAAVLYLVITTLSDRVFSRAEGYFSRGMKRKAGA